MIDARALVACGVKPLQATLFAGPLVATCERFEIAPGRRFQGFLAQAIWESTGFSHLVEDTYYSKPEFIYNAFKRLRPLGMAGLIPLCRNSRRLANVAYAGINGNGDEASGDGWNYRGGGIFMLTGLDNYRETGLALGVDLVAHPELVRQDPMLACLSAGLFWHTHDLNKWMDADNFDHTTTVINGGQNGAKERRKLYALASSVFNKAP